MSLQASVRGVFDKASFILGYGSGVFPQAGRLPGIPDFIIVTRDVKAFHETNMKRYPSHYSALVRSSPSIVSYLNSTSPYTHFALNAILPTGLFCKYGVIGFSELSSILTSWRSLYIPGRLHKPTMLIECADKPSYESLLPTLTQNRLQALSLAALLPYPYKSISHDELFHSLVGLSYLGDLRMHVAEAPSKVSDIVRGQNGELLEIYRDLFTKAGLSSCGLTLSDPKLAISRLPPILITDLPRNNFQVISTELRRRISIINRFDSASQAVKGVLTNPLKKSFFYVARKIAKRIA